MIILPHREKRAFYLPVLMLGIYFISVIGCKSPGSEKATPTGNAPAERIAAHDSAVHILDDWIRDPYIYLADDGYYYLTGTTVQPNDPREASEPYNTGLPATSSENQTTPSMVGHSIRVWRSPDLADWEYMGEPFTLDQGYWAQTDAAAFADTPKEEWHLWAPELYQVDGRWVYVHTTPAPVQGGANLAITTGASPDGPFTFPLEANMRGKHDPSLFRDVDDSWYLLWGNTQIVPLKAGFSGLAGEAKRIDPADRKIGHEGATLRKIGDKYVHFGTAWSTDQMRKGSYNLYYCTSDSVMGSYGPRQFAGRFLGHGTPFQDKQGRWWCTAFFNANVPPLDGAGIEHKDLGSTAQTINEKGTTLVPLEVRILDDGEIFIRAKDPRYRNPGPDEAQEFTRE
jgi:arylsulfatase